MRPKRELSIDLPSPRGSLFSRLYGIVSGERSRLEDFLTEAFSELLAQLDKPDLIAFFEEFFLKGCNQDIRSSWLCLANTQNRIFVRTQPSIWVKGIANSKRPDIVLYGDHLPIAVIECKVAAQFTTTEEIANEEVRELDQLDVYDRWLNDYGGPHAPLILLTQSSRSPPGFLNQAKSRNVCRWSELHRFISSSEPASVIWREKFSAKNTWLFNEFLAFMREEEMTLEDIQGKDVAAALLYMPSHQRLLKCVEEATKLIDIGARSLGRTFTQLTKGVYVYSDEAYVVAGLYDKEIEVGWGFWFGFGDVSTWNHSYEPLCTRAAGPTVYIEHSRPIRRPNIDAVAQWIFPKLDTGHNDAFKLASFEYFLEQPDSSRRIAEWLKSGFDEAVEIVKAL